MHLAFKCEFTDRHLRTLLTFFAKICETDKAKLFFKKSHIKDCCKLSEELCSKVFLLFTEESVNCPELVEQHGIRKEGKTKQDCCLFVQYILFYFFLFSSGVREMFTLLLQAIFLIQCLYISATCLK